MDDLFRFVLLRPAIRPASDDINQLTASFVRPGTARDIARRAARAFVDDTTHPTSADGMKYSKVALEVVSRLGTNRLKATEISTIIKDSTGETATKVVDDPKFGEEATLLANLLVAMKLLSDSSGMDAPGLALVAQGYDAIRLVAAGRDPVYLRVMSIGGFPSGRQDVLPPGDSPPASPPADEGAPALSLLADLNNAIAALGSVPASSFHVEGPSSVGDRSGRSERAIMARAQATQPWVMSQAAISSLPSPVQNVLSTLGLDLGTQPLTQVIEALHARRAEEQMALAELEIPRSTLVSQFGNGFATIASRDYVGEPSSPLPTGHGSIRPVGIGDLLMVKQHVLRYEGGDLAHIENVLKSEHLSRDTRRLERTETTVLQEMETTKEETRDTQTTDRFSLRRETSDTIKTDSSVKAGLSVSAKYGPTVEVKANTEAATSTSAESAAKQASEFSKDVIERSASKLVERILERRTVTTITEFEEKYSHGFDNTGGAGHITGYYQWVDKILQAQVYNYGKRLLFDVTVPEPGTNFILSQTLAKDAAQPLEKPPAFTAIASDINEGNYRIWAKRYDATGLEPPPPPLKTIAKAISGVFLQEPHTSNDAAVLEIEDGYRAKYVLFEKDAVPGPGARWRVFVGSSWFDAMTADRYRNLAGETKSVGYAYDALDISVMSASIEIFCERTQRAFEAWQLKTHAAITQAYLAKKEAYDQALAQARAAAATVIAGRNPLFNQRLVANELRRQCLTLLTGQQFDGFGALELSAEGYAQPNLSRSGAQMPYVRFFEQAFEWDNIVYFFYPYFWGWKKGWKNRMLLDDADPPFGDFLRAGAARVVFPVRPGFEAAVLHYLETPQGEIWNGGPMPDNIGDPLFVPIIKEIQESTGAPGNEQPVGDPWEVRLPTTLVRLRPHDDLPMWHKVGEKWEPVN